MMTQALLVLRLYAAQDRSLHCRSLESGSGDKHHQPQEDVASKAFLFLVPRIKVGVWRSDECWKWKSVWKGRHLWRMSKCFLVKLGKIQANEFLVPVPAPHPPTPTQRKQQES